LIDQPASGLPYSPGVAHDDLQLIVARTPGAVWQALRGQHLFITGGTGFIGCWLVEALLWANHTLDLQLRLSLLTRDAAAFVRKAPHLAGHSAVTLIEGDVGDLAALSGPFDVVIHAATDVARPGEDAGATFDNIVGGTAQTLALASRSQARRYLLTSSGAVYGVQDPAQPNIPDDDPAVPSADAPAAAYGRGKRASEALLHEAAAAQPGLAVTSARLFALLGPYLPLEAHFAAGNFIADALRGGAITVRGDGTPQRSYLYAADMVVWLLTILMLGQSGQCFNVGSERALSVAQLAALIAASVPGAGPVRIAVVADGTTTAPRYVPATAKARAVLGLAEYTDLSSALSKTIDWSIEQQRKNHHA
jgi:nucleoside-diphosphate-sugar epimerase